MPIVVSHILEFIPKIAKKYEILVVNDGSTDNTSVVAQRLAKRYKNILVIDQKNKGYGGALKAGIKASKYEWIFYTDSDLQFDLKDIFKFVYEANFNDVILGYRVNRAEGFRRLMIAELLRVWNRIFLGFPLYVKDIDCAFKLIRREVFEDVGDIISDGAMFSTEFLLRAYKLGYRFVQVGVSHYPRKNGRETGNKLNVIFRAISETFILRSLIAEEPRYTLKPRFLGTNS